MSMYIISEKELKALINEKEKADETIDYLRNRVTSLEKRLDEQVKRNLVLAAANDDAKREIGRMRSICDELYGKNEESEKKINKEETDTKKSVEAELKKLDEQLVQEILMLISAII